MNESLIHDMTEEGVVLSVRGGMAVVESVQNDACASCGARGACHALSGEQKREVPALNQVGAREGDRVLMALPRKAVLGAGFLVYIAPIIALIAGAVLGRTLAPAWGWDGQTGAVIAGLAFLVICWLILRRVSRLLGRRRDFSVRIVRVIRKGETHALEQHPVGL